MPIRIAVIGAHRRHTGTGPFVAEWLRRSGCIVTFWDQEKARSPSETDAVAICSPTETHLEYLESAVARGFHIFCEKPMVWPADHSEANFEAVVGRLAEALEAARKRGLVVHENTQWVYTLEDFRRIAGEYDPARVRRFRCELSPSAGNAAEMLMECSAHANSLLLALGCSRAENVRARFQEGAGAALSVDFDSRNASGAKVEAEYRFTQQLAQPRHAAYEIDDRRVERRVEINGYRMFLRSEETEAAIDDPLGRSAADFVGQVRNGAREGVPARIMANIAMSRLLLAACRRPAEPAHA